jgi:hypothetical protein
MSKLLANSLVALLFSVVIVLTTLGQAPTFDPHDLSGVWTKGDGFRSLALSAKPPAFTPLGQKLFDANKPSYGPRAVPPALGNDPTGNCDPLGLVRNIILEVGIYRMEFVPTKDRLFQFFEWAHSYRTIWTDGSQLPKDPDATFNGISAGKWDGDTFVVDSVGFDDRTWLDHFGVPHSDEMRLQERYRRISQDNLEMTVTLTDPKIFVTPWEGDKRIFKLVPKAKFPEMFCVPSQEQEFNRVVRDPAAGLKK